MRHKKYGSLQDRDNIIKELGREYPDQDTIMRLSCKISDLQGRIETLEKENDTSKETVKKLRLEKRNLRKRIKELETNKDKVD
jgi:phage shock protein A